MKKVVIVGTGALGSHVAMLLRNEAALKLVDFDRVERKNLAAQFFNKGSVGRNKAQALQGLMSLLWDTKTEMVPHKLTKDNNVELLKDSDLVIDCLDNGEGRRAVQDFTLRYTNPATGAPHVACLHGALAAEGQLGRVVWDEKFAVDDEDGPGQATCEGGEFLPFVTITAAYVAYAAQQYLKTGRKTSFQVTPAGVMKI